jgi:hypothetical protein
MKSSLIVLLAVTIASFSVLSQDDDKNGYYYLNGIHSLVKSTSHGNTCLTEVKGSNTVLQGKTEYIISNDNKTVDSTKTWALVPKENITYKDCDMEELLPSGAKFSIVKTIPATKTSPEYYVISFPSWGEIKRYCYKNDSKVRRSGKIRKCNNVSSVTYVPNPKTEKFSEKNGEKIYFRISESQLNHISTKVKAKFEPMVGAMTFPFKFRFDKDDGMFFTKDISLTGLGGVKYNVRKVNDLSFSFYTGIGLTSVALNARNTDSTILNTTNRAGASIPIGVLMQWKVLQIGVSMGFDFLSSETRDNWKFHGKPWLSFGIGISIFNPKSKNSSKRAATNKTKK